MKSEQRSLLAILLSTAIFVVWLVVAAPKAKPPTSTSSASNSAPTEVPRVTSMPTTSTDPQAAVSVETTTMTTPRYTAELSSDGGVITAWQLYAYRKGTEATSAPIDLVSADGPLPAALALGFLDANFSVPDYPRFRVLARSSQAITYAWRSADVEIVKTLVFHPDHFAVDVTVTVTNLSQRPLEERPVLRWGGVSRPRATGGFLSFLRQPPADNKQPLYYIDGKVQREQNVARLVAEKEASGTLYWAGLEDRYFLVAIIPRQPGEGVTARVGASDLSALGSGARGVTAGVALARTTIPPGERVSHSFSVYAGPKEIGELKALGLRLDEAIDYGWFAAVALPIRYLLNFFYRLIHNYGVAIILLTVFIKLLLQPISRKSLKSMKAMQRLQPQIKELQAKYKNDRARLNQETMSLFRAHKVNPMGGCLPMLLQFPIYIALYKVLWNSIELYHAPFFWFYRDLAAPDPYFITPIVLGLFMVAQQKLMPSTSADPAQQKMMMFMPIMFSAFMLFLPVGLTVYILVNTVMSVTQQWMFNHDLRFRDLLRGKLPT